MPCKRDEGVRDSGRIVSDELRYIAEAILAASPQPNDEDGGWRSQQEWQALLDGRDKFIVAQGLWMDFVASLPKGINETSPARPVTGGGAL